MEISQFRLDLIPNLDEKAFTDSTVFNTGIKYWRTG